MSSQSDCNYFCTAGINWIAAKELKHRSAGYLLHTFQLEEISVFDVVISIAGLLIPFNSGCDRGQAWRKPHE